MKRTAPETTQEPGSLSHPRMASEVEDWMDQGPMHATHSGRWRVRCRFMKKDGTRCKNWSRRGAVVCRVPQHGGSLPSVLKKAEERFAYLSNASFDEFMYALMPISEKLVRLRAARNVLKMTHVDLGLNVPREVAITKVDDLIAELKKGKVNEEAA